MKHGLYQEMDKKKKKKKGRLGIGNGLIFYASKTDKVINVWWNTIMMGSK
jgi:hypothetical protein